MSTEPYDYIYGEDVELVSHNYPKYSPILSMVTTNENTDIPIPTWDDWVRISNQEDKFFPKQYRSKKYDFSSIKWEDKKSIAVFRGGTTGCGTDIHTNMRLKVADMSSKNLIDDNGLPYLDAGVTNWNVRPRIYPKSGYLDTIEVPELGFDLVDQLDPLEQSEFKYIINIEGHVAAYRLSLELDMGSVILLVESKYKLWYNEYLKPYVHYVPVDHDLENLIEQIKWCKTHDIECQKIVDNAKRIL